MSGPLRHYLGRNVCLTHEKFHSIKTRASRRGHTLENRFIVSQVSPGARRLTCYGASYRIVVDASDVVLL